MAKANIRAKLKWYLENPALPDDEAAQTGSSTPAQADSSTPAKPKSTALPRLPVETRFGSMIITMRDVQRCKPALEATVLSPLVTDDYVGDFKVQVSLQCCASF